MCSCTSLQIIIGFFSLQLIQEKIEEKERRDDEEQDRLEALAKERRKTVVLPKQRNIWVSKFIDAALNVAPFILFFTFAYIVQLVIRSS